MITECWTPQSSHRDTFFLYISCSFSINTCTCIYLSIHPSIIYIVHVHVYIYLFIHPSFYIVHVYHYIIIIPHIPNISIHVHYLHFVAILTVQLSRKSGSVTITTSSDSHVTKILQQESVVFKVLSLIVPDIINFTYYYCTSIDYSVLCE